MRLICKFEHGFVSESISKSDDFIKFLISNFKFNSIDFLFFITVFPNEFSCKDIIFELCLSRKQFHIKFLSKWFYPNIQRSRNNIGFGMGSIDIINEIQSVFSEQTWVVFFKELLRFFFFFLSGFTFQNGCNQTFLDRFCVC